MMVVIWSLPTDRHRFEQDSCANAAGFVES